MKAWFEKYRWWFIGAAILFLAIAAWESHRKSVDVAVAQSKAESDRASIAAIDQAAKQRQAEYDKQVSALNAQIADLSKQSNKVVVEKIISPVLPQPIHVVPQPSTQTAAGQTDTHQQTPTVVPGDAILPQADIKPLASALLDGQKCHLDLTKCVGDRDDFDRKYQLASDEADNWKKAAKGGSVWRRTWTTAAKIAIGAAAGYVAGRLAK